MLNSPVPGDGLREGLVFHREQRGCPPWGITGPGWTLRDAGTGSCREFLPRSPPARALPWVFQAVESLVFALGLSRARGASEPPHAQPVVSSCPAASQDRVFLYPLKILQDLGWQLRIRALWWHREGRSPSIHLAAGRTLPRSPQTASGLGCSETAAFFWKDVGWRIVICVQRGWKSAGGAQGLRLIETDRAVQEAGSGQAALPALHFPTNYLSASKRKKKKRGFVRINKKLFIRINNCI